MDNGNILIRVGADISAFSRSMASATSDLDRFQQANSATFKAFKQSGMAFTAAGVAIAAGLGVAVKSASDYQSAFAGVRKTVDASESEFAALSKGIRDMAKVLPATANEISAVAEAAGQLGIKKENILAFARTMVDLGESTNLTAEEAATSFAQFANVVGMPQENFSRLGSSVVALGNSMATTEADIVNMAMRLSGTGAQVGLTEAQIMALSATMSSVGINAEAGGSAMSTVMKKISNAVSEGGKKMDGFAKAAGMSSTEFATAWKNDPITALDSFIKGLSASGIEGANLNGILKDLGIKGIQETDTLLRLAGASDLLSGAVATSSQAWADNSALTDEAAQRYATFESKIAMFKNVLTDIGITIGNVLLPVVTSLVDFITNLASKFSEMNPQLVSGAVVFAAVAAGILLIVGPILLLIGFIPAIISGFGAIATVLGTTAAVLAKTILVMSGIGVAIALVIAALALAYNKVEWFRDGVDAAWAKIKTATDTAFQAIKQVVTTLITATVDASKKVLDDFKAYWAANGEGILQKAKSAFETIKTTLSKIITDVVTFVKTQLDKFKAFWDENGAAITALVKASFGQIKKDIEVVMGIIKGIFQVAWPIITNVIKVAWNTIKLTIGNAIDLVLGIIQTVMKLIQGDWKGAWETIKVTAEKIMGNIVKFFEDVDLLQVGKDIIQGLIDGIGSMVEAVKKKVTELASAMPDWIKKVLGIHSPSRVFTVIGGQVGQGLANGVAGTKSEAVSAITAVTKAITAAAKTNAAEVTKIATEAEKKRTEIQKEYAAKRAELTRKSTQSAHSALKTSKNKKGEIVTTGANRVHTIRADASAKLIKLNEDEQKKLAAVNNKAWADMTKKEAELTKAKLEAIKTYVADKKSLEQLSIVAETEVWRKSIDLFKVGTKERIEAQKSYQASLKVVNEAISKTNEEYAGKMSVINDRLRKEEEDLTTMYTKTVDERAKALVSFAGTFDLFEVKLEKTGEDLMWNLKSQVLGFKRWQQEIEELSAKAIDEGLIEELRAMGPKALPELIALNSLTDKQMTEYSSLYKEKAVLARTQAERELVGMKADTEKRIRELRSVANRELEVLRVDWVTQIKGITKASDDELMSLKKIGRQAAEGLKTGLESMEPALVRTATSIANAVKKAMAGAFDIHSPSRWMRDFIGVNMMAGWIAGMSSMRSDVLAMSANASGWMTPDVPKVAGYQTPSNSSGVGRAVLNSSDTDSGKSGGFSPQITNHFTPAQSSPSESARQQKRILQEIAIGFR